MLALVLNLSLSGLKPRQGALTAFLKSFKLLGQLGLLLLDRPKRLLHLAPEVRLSLKFIMNAPNALFGHKNLLGDLHETTRGLHKIHTKRIKMPMELYSPLRGPSLET